MSVRKVLLPCLSPGLLLGSALTLAGCANLASFPDAATTSAQGAGLQGRIHGGQQAVSGSHIHLMAAASAGYGSAAVSLLQASKTGNSDSLGAYVLSDANGAFSISNDYTCTAGQVVYVLATQGNPGIGSNNPALSMMAVVGTCPAATNFAAATPFPVYQRGQHGGGGLFTRRLHHRRIPPELQRYDAGADWASERSLDRPDAGSPGNGGTR